MRHLGFYVISVLQSSLKTTVVCFRIGRGEDVIFDYDTSVKALATSQKNLAILVLIIDEFPHEAIWRTWLNFGSVSEKSRIKFFFHAKYPEKIQSHWVKRQLSRCHEKTSWGSIGITKAMLGLLKEVYVLIPISSFLVSKRYLDELPGNRR